MARVTIADLLERIDAMQEEIDSLRAHIDASLTAPALQYVREIKPPNPISSPLDFMAMAGQASFLYSHYSEEDDWGANKYL